MISVRPLCTLLLAASILFGAGCDSGPAPESDDPGDPVSIASVRVDDSQRFAVTWAAYEGSDFDAYRVLRASPSTNGALQTVAEIASRDSTVLREPLPGFVEGTIRYRVDVLRADAKPLTGETIQYEAAAPVLAPLQRSGSEFTLAWSRYPFDGLVAKYEVQRTKGRLGFVEARVQTDASDTTWVDTRRFGTESSDADYRVVTHLKGERDSLVSNVRELRFGTPVPYHRNAAYVSERDELYLWMNEPQFGGVYRVDANTLDIIDSLSAEVSVSPGAEAVAEIPFGEPTIRLLDARTFEPIKTYSTASIPKYDESDMRIFRPQILSGRRLLYLAEDSDALMIYDLEADSLIDQTPESASPQVVSESERYVVGTESEGFVTYEITQAGFRRVLSRPFSNPLTLMRRASGTEWAVQYEDGGQVTFYRLPSGDRGSTITIDEPFDNLAGDAGADVLWTVDWAQNRVLGFDPDTGERAFAFDVVYTSGGQYTVTGGVLTSDRGRLLRLNE